MIKARPNLEWGYLFAAWVVALIASFSALFIGEVMGQAPCNLCWFQRVFMFPLVIILPIALLRDEKTVWAYALPLAILGSIIAIFHTLIYTRVVPEGIKPCRQGPSCTNADMTIFGTFPLPLLSLVAFTAVTVLLLLVRRKDA